MSAQLGQRELVERLVAFSRRLHPGDRIISDIIPGVRAQDAADLSAEAQLRLERACKTTFAAFIFHPEKTVRESLTEDPRDYFLQHGRYGNTDPAAEVLQQEAEERGHIHVYHNCRFTASWCRCNWIGPRGLIFKRRGLPRKLLYCKDLTEEYWRNWVQYYSTAPRRFLFVATHEVPGQVGTIRGAEGVQRHEGAEKIGPYEHVETCFLSRQARGRQSVGSSRDSASTSSSQGTSGSDGGKRIKDPGSGYRPCSVVSKKILEFDKLLIAIRSFCVVPIYSTCDDTDWIKHPALRWYNRGDPDYKRACDLICREIEQFTDSDIVAYVTLAPKPKWSSKGLDYYYDEEESTQILIKLLETQYGEEVGPFVDRCRKICNKAIPKKNSMYIEGPPNSGKTFFIECLAAFYLNPGHVANFVRGENFPLQDAVNKRFLVWNEPSIAPSQFEDVKMLCGGDPLPARVKYMGNTIVTRTPLFFTANHQVFPKEDTVWSSRIFFEQWIQADFLRECHKYLHPMSWLNVLNKYK
nr:MAG: nonstructural protein 1 [Parvoviridae sp.]